MTDHERLVRERFAEADGKPYVVFTGDADHEIRLLLDAVDEARARVTELRASFDLRWNADMRAIKRWQAATGRDLVWPDHADLVVWLLDQLETRG